MCGIEASRLLGLRSVEMILLTLRVLAVSALTLIVIEADWRTAATEGFALADGLLADV